MNNYYTLLSLVEELRYKMPGKEVIEVWSHRKDQIDIFFQPAGSGKLTFSASSPGTALFWDARAGMPSRNAASFFPEITGKNVSDIEMVSSHDRLVRITFIESSFELVFKPFSSRPNLFLTRDGVIKSAFKSPSDWAGKSAPEPAKPTPKTTKTPDGSADNQPRNTGESLHKLPLKKRIIAIDRSFPRGLINDIIDTCRLDETIGNDELARKIGDLQSLLSNPKEIYITAEGHISLLPKEYLSYPPDRIFDNVNDAVRTLFLSENQKKRLLPRKNDLLKKLQKRLRGLEKQIKEFEKEPERLEKADRLEHFGHLLMSQADPTSQVAGSELKVTDWSDEGSEITIPVKSGNTPVKQAQEYYDKAAKIRQDVSMSAKKKRQIASQLTEIRKRVDELSEIEHPSALEKWFRKHKEQLQQMGLSPSDEKQEARPYRLVKLGDYEVWIGKSATSNDALLSLAHKEDIWMHVRGAAGSHVILRNKSQTGWPDNALVHKVASFAAAYSRQVGSSMVPVMAAKRKHVRKPKGAAPGQVTVTNERVEMVTPAKPDLPDS